MKFVFRIGDMLWVAGLVWAMVTVSSGAAIAQVVDGHAADRHDRRAPVADEPIAAAPWATDAPLREGMRRIREAVLVVLPDYRRHALQQVDATALAVEIESSIGYLFANCRLEPDADAVLHGLLAQLLQGAAALRSNPSGGAGLPDVLSALERYPHLFVDAQWQTIP
jgi:hypothetical protein